MKKTTKKFTDGLFTKSRQGSGELTHKAVESYLSKARRMQSEYAYNLLNRSYRRLGGYFSRDIRWTGAASGKKRRRLGVYVNG